MAGWASAALTLAAVFFYGILAFPPPWKILDPTDPRFDVTQFRLTDHQGGIPFRNIRERFFPYSSFEEHVRVLASESRKDREDRINERKKLDLRETLQILLPIGTDKSQVDKILVSYGGATPKDTQSKAPRITGGNYKNFSYTVMPFTAYIESFVYGYPPEEFDITVFVIYNEDNKMEAASFHENYDEFGREEINTPAKKGGK